jgi:hypothetical protein
VDRPHYSRALRIRSRQPVRLGAYKGETFIVPFPSTKTPDLVDIEELAVKITHNLRDQLRSEREDAGRHARGELESKLVS